MEELPKHIQEMYNKARTIKYNSKGYWELRCRMREKMEDLTYTEFERTHARNIWKILIKRTRK